MKHDQQNKYLRKTEGRDKMMYLNSYGSSECCVFKGVDNKTSPPTTFASQTSHYSGFRIADIAHFLERSF